MKRKNSQTLCTNIHTNSRVTLKTSPARLTANKCCHTIEANYVNKTIAGNAIHRFFSQCPLYTNILTDRALFLPRSVFLSILLYFLLRF